MTHRILKSDIAGVADFEAAVSAHAFEMKNWRAHMERVKRDEANGVTGIEKYMPHPRPAAPPPVEAAVNENDEPDYEIVDDGPTPEQLLLAQKAQLLSAVALAELAAIADVVPAGKRRLFNMRENDIGISDSSHAQAAMADRGLLAKAASAIGVGKIDWPDEIRKRRSPEDNRFLEEQAARREKIAAIERLAAQAHYDIEELTAETIGAWRAPDFSKIS